MSKKKRSKQRQRKPSTKSLINLVKDACDRLASRGWRDLLLEVTDNGLDISQSSGSKLEAALTASLATIHRTRIGFEDFDENGKRGVTGGQPGKSLLYHALASPSVHPSTDGSPTGTKADYPTLEELDAIENFIYSLVSDRTDLDDTVVAVFAYQYRVASRTSHRRHADIAYSRTGVARVGTTKPNYDPSRRSFWVLPSNGDDALAVLPARYGVFLARRAKPGSAGSVQGGNTGARDAEFLFPVHKLFPGKECLDGQKLGVKYHEFHRNEKLRKTHSLSLSEGGLPVPAGFDTTKLPYVRDSRNGGKLASLDSVGASVLVVPKPGDSLVRTVSQKNSVSRKNQIVHFVVPATQFVRGRETRFGTSSLEIPAFGGDRLSPEYANIRHQVDPSGPPDQTPTDMITFSDAAFAAALTNGGYPAAHFTDDSCDGCLEAVVDGLSATRENRPAFSLITAPDFMPLADQFEVETDPNLSNVEPLSKGRLPVNPTLPRPSTNGAPVFARTDTTVTAIVGAAAFGSQTPIIGHPNRMISFLPDAASNVFAPGWDTSRSRDGGGSFLTSSGLGSPFPEDAKLCAALASFWPAVAPDNGRTFGNNGWGNQLPMLDEELGFHPKHERVQSGETSSYLGWDGEFGPFFEKVGGKLNVNFVRIERSDYVSHALAGRISLSRTAEIQSEELINRALALTACESVLVPRSRACLVVVRKIDDWATAGRGKPELTGAGYLMEFGDLTGDEKTTSEIERVRRAVTKRHICQVGSNGIAYKNGSAAFTFTPF